jgi:hypothetical protein
MTGTNCDLFTHKSSRSYLNHLVAAKNHSTGDSIRKEEHDNIIDKNIIVYSKHVL